EPSASSSASSSSAGGRISIGLERVGSGIGGVVRTSKKTNLVKGVINMFLRKQQDLLPSSSSRKEYKTY
ncbi:hypothetical protein HDU82_006346, partial [Entophlyctis luteolus]